jgi:hypothetical protein
MEVLTYNESTQKQESGIVTNLTTAFKLDIISILFSNESIECTIDHPFWVVGKGWSCFNPASQVLPTSQLQEGDILLDEKGNQIVIDRILENVLPKPIPEPVFTFEVAGNHNFYANGILVHNKDTQVTINGQPATSSDIKSLLDEIKNTFGLNQYVGGQYGGGKGTTGAY